LSTYKQWRSNEKGCALLIGQEKGTAVGPSRSHAGKEARSDADKGWRMKNKMGGGKKSGGQSESSVEPKSAINKKAKRTGKRGKEPAIDSGRVTTQE